MVGFAAINGRPVWPRAARLDTARIMVVKAPKQGEREQARSGNRRGAGPIRHTGKEKAGDCRGNKAGQHLMSVPQMGGNDARKSQPSSTAPQTVMNPIAASAASKKNVRNPSAARQHLAKGCPVASR
jgi:hypothetical protein